MRLLRLLLARLSLRLAIYWLQARLAWPTVRTDRPLIAAAVAIAALWLWRKV